MTFKTILVTGAAGFIGSHVSELLLQQGYDVVGIDNFDAFYDKSIKKQNLQILTQSYKFKFFEADIRNLKDLEKLPTSVDAVIHLAAKAGVLPSIKDPQGYIDTNITGTLNLLTWMNSYSIKKLVFASSSSIYGNHTTIPYTEDLPVDHPISPYAFTKKSCELLNYNFHHLYNFDILNLRLFTVFGPRQRPDLAIHKFFSLISEGKELTVYGDGSTSRDYTYVSDIANGFLAALDYLSANNKVYEILNIGNHSPVKLLKLIQAIGETLNTKPNLTFLPMQPGDVEITYADISKAKKLLGYQPHTSLMEGLSNFNNWFQESKASFS